MRKKGRKGWRAGTVPFYGLKTQKKKGPLLPAFPVGDVPFREKMRNLSVIEMSAVC